MRESLRVPHASAMERRLLSPEEIAAAAGSNTPYLRLPERSAVFAPRAARLRALAPGHPMGGYLEFVAVVADAQQAALDAMPALAPIGAADLDASAEHGMPPFAHASHARDPAWRTVLRRIAREVADRSDAPRRAIIAPLVDAPDAMLEQQAGKLLAGIAFDLDIARAPIIAAALQVYFAHRVIELGVDAFSRVDPPTVCPCCGSRPVASVLRIGGREGGFRFLHCALCSAEWHMVRVKCSNCESTKGIDYRALDDGKPVQRHAVRAEACAECGTYLKLCAMDVDQAVDPVADDLATVALDLLMVEAGSSPSGVNFMLIHGDPEAP